MSFWNGELVRFGFRQLLRSKKTWAAVAVSSIPVLAGFILIGSDVAYANNYPNDEMYVDITEWLAFFAIGGTVPLVALLLAGGLLADESQDRTLTYLLTRPIKRSTIYVSKFVPVAVVTAVLAAAQVLLFGLLRMLAIVFVDPDAMVRTVDNTWVSALGLVAMMIPVGILAAALAGMAYCALFAFISLVVPRFHFMVNLLVYGFWELLFGSIGGAGLGFLTILFHAQSLVSRVDPTVDGLHASSVHPAFATFALVAAVAFWLWLGAHRIKKQDFHVTSATT